MAAIHESKAHIALLVSPGIGHVIPFLELAKRLSLYNLQITLFVVSGGSSLTESDILQKSSSSTQSSNVVLLPPVDVSGLVEESASFIDKINAMMREVLKDFQSTIITMKNRPVALIVDLFGTKALTMSRELGILSFIFMTTNAWFLAFTRFLPSIDRRCFENQHEPLRIPGCRPVRLEDMADFIPTGEEYEDFIHFCNSFGLADGILSNTWQDLESTSLKALNEAGTLTLGKRKLSHVPVYPVGPLIRQHEPGLKHEVLDWLEKQTEESVVYVSFGSGGTLTKEQIRELAWGLELSQQRFVWVIRPAMKNDDAAGSYFTVGKTSSDPETETEKEYNLPEGFMKRTKERGIVVGMWAPQREILSHGSIGGFISHCGWNSTMESLVNGVPIIAWPLYAEQKMNATFLSEELRVGVRMKGIVVREEIEKMVKMIMEKDNEQGREIRDRVKEIKRSGEKAMGINGTSNDSLLQLATSFQAERLKNF